VLVGGLDPWPSTALAMLRRATPAALVVLGDLPAQQVVVTLRAGADLVVSGQAGDEEVLARVTAIVRRTTTGADASVRYLLAGGIRVDLLAAHVMLDGHRVPVSPTEYRLLVCLMRSAGKMVPVTQLLDRVWGWADGDGLNTVRIFVGRLRRKLGDDARKPRYIGSVRGSGYTFLAPVLEQGEESPAKMVSGEEGLLDSIAHLAEQMVSCRDVSEGAELVVRSLVSSGAADAVGLLRIEDDRLRVICEMGFSEAWERAMKAGLPLDTAYASVHAAVTGEATQFTRAGLTGVKHAATFKLLVGEEFDVGVFLPIYDRGAGWGSMGAVRRSTAQFGALTISYFKSVLAIYSSALPRLAPGAHGLNTSLDPTHPDLLRQLPAG